MNYSLNYCYWWLEHALAPDLHALLVKVTDLHRATIGRHGFGTPMVWRQFVDALYDLLQEADTVSAGDRRLIWQDSYGIRAVQCACRHTYVPPAAASGKWPVWWVHAP